MPNVINGICIKDKAILLVQKRKTWILPGGKPFKDEMDAACLTREIQEELPKSSLVIRNPFGMFKGISPHSNNPITVQTFLVDIEGDITPAAEISAAGFYNREKLKGLPLSGVTRQIIDNLTSKELL